MTQITIIIPVFNAERFLRDCLDSVVRQTVQEKEIICVNDGSQDGSRDILEEYGSRYSFIRLLEQENRGAGAARNLALSRASGKYISFLDADDILLNNYSLERMVDDAEKMQAEVVGSFRSTVLDGKIKEEDFLKEYCPLDKTGAWINYLDYQEDYHYQSYIFRRNLIENREIRFPLYRRYQDPPFFVRVMLAAGKFWVCPVHHYGYRYGIQDQKTIALQIKESLKGMCDVLSVAKKNNLTILQGRIADRLCDRHYRQAIRLFPFDCELASLCGHILELLPSEEAEKVNFFKNISTLNDMDTLAESHTTYRYLLEMHHKGIRFANEVKRYGIKRITIYGLGVYGEVLYQELRDSDIEVTGGVDRTRTEFHALPIVKIREAEMTSDAILVSNLDYYDIVNELRMQVHCKVFSFVEMIKKIHDGIGED